MKSIRTAREERTFVITGKKYNGATMTKVFEAFTDYDEEGNIAPRYDGAETWYYVSRIVTKTGMPCGCRGFAGDREKAMKYFLNGNY